MSQWNKCPVEQMSSGTTVQWDKCHTGTNVTLGQMSQWDKCPVGQMSGGQMSSGTVVQWDKCPVGQLSVGQLSHHPYLHILNFWIGKFCINKFNKCVTVMGIQSLVILCIIKPNLLRKCSFSVPFHFTFHMPQWAEQITTIVIVYMVFISHEIS